MLKSERAQPPKAGLLTMWFLLTLLGLVFFDPLPQLHRFLLLCLLPPRGLLQRQLDQIIGELGHGDSALLGLVVKRADKETGQGRGVVLGSGHSPFRFLVLNERTEFNSLYPQRNRLRKRGAMKAHQLPIHLLNPGLSDVRRADAAGPY